MVRPPSSTHQPLFSRCTTEPKHKTDIVAIDYAPRWTPTPVLMKAERDSISRKLDHISTDRLLEHPGWDVIDLARRTLDLFNRFVESLPPIEA